MTNAAARVHRPTSSSAAHSASTQGTAKVPSTTRWSWAPRSRTSKARMDSVKLCTAAGLRSFIHAAKPKTPAMKTRASRLVVTSIFRQALTVPPRRRRAR